MGYMLFKVFNLLSAFSNDCHSTHIHTYIILGMEEYMGCPRYSQVGYIVPFEAG